MLNKVKEQVARAVDKVDEKMLARVDEQLDRVQALRRKAPAEKNASVAQPPSAAVAPGAAPAPSPQKAVDAAAAARAFESVPKEELVSLVVKTNGRCKQLETRYAELKRLHEQLLEEKRAMVATKGRAGASQAAERDQIETTLRQSYEDRLAELEEQATASQAIKKQLQLELETASARFRDESTARKSAEAQLGATRADSNQLRAELDGATAAAERATREATSARSAAATEQAALLERVMTLQGEAASMQANGGKAPSGGGGSGSAADAARLAEREEALAAQQRLREMLSASEAKLAAAQGELSQAERASASAAATARAEHDQLESDLRDKERALSRALSNYKEEVGRWGERIQAVEQSKTEAAAAAAREAEVVNAQWEAKLQAERDEAAANASQARVEWEAELAISRSTAAAESGDARERVARSERQTQKRVAEAERTRDEAVGEAREAEETSRRAAAQRVLAAEESASRAKASEASLLRERDELARKLVAAQEEVLAMSKRSSKQVEKWAQHSASASEHEAVVQRLRVQLEEAEGGYRQARSVKASLEAEVAAGRAQLDQQAEEAIGLREQLDAARAEGEAAVATKEKEAQSWKAKWKAQSASSSEAAEKLDGAERRLLAEAASHAASVAARDGRVKELEEQLDSGRPAEAHMFAMAREQAKRDEEVGRLRMQLKSLRDMLRESHKVLKHLMQQESLLKAELHTARRDNQRADGLNVEYVKNVLVAFMSKVYGDAENEEHIKLARVLQTLLHFAPDDAARVEEHIAAYEASWWHTTANLLKSDAAGASTASWFGTSWFSGSSAAAPAASSAG